MEIKTPMQVYEEILGAGVPDIQVASAEEKERIAGEMEKVEGKNQNLRTALDTLRQRMETGQKKMELRNDVSRDDYGAIATAARQVESLAGEVDAQLNAWMSIWLAETRATIGRTKDAAKKAKTDATNKIAEMDLDTLQRQRKAGQEAVARSIKPKKGETAIQVTSSLKSKPVVVDAEKVPQELCSPNQKLIEEEMKKKGTETPISGVKMQDSVTVRILPTSGKRA